MQEKDFTRKRKLGFAEVSTMILKGIKRGLHAGIIEFLEETNTEVEEYSKAAFCKARQRIKPSCFFAPKSILSDLLKLLLIAKVSKKNLR